MKKILVTGGAGYIGTTLIPMLLAKQYDVTVVDSLLFNNGDKLIPFVNNKNFNFVKGDVRDVELMSNLVKDKDVVIHLAALVGFPICREKGEKESFEPVTSNLFTRRVGQGEFLIVNKYCFWKYELSWGPAIMLFVRHGSPDDNLLDLMFEAIRKEFKNHTTEYYEIQHEAFDNDAFKDYFGKKSLSILQNLLSELEEEDEETIHTYANNINTADGGTHLSGFKTSITRVVNQ